MIYYVEDELNIRELVIYTLRSAGYEARGFADSGTFFEAVRENMPELVLLDIMLPGEDGIQILKKLRAAENTRHLPIIMITAKSAEFDKVSGLDEGADDYITKPFGMVEFLARVRALLRRTKAHEEKTVFTKENLMLDMKKHSVTVDGEEVRLTVKEFDLLRYLFQNQGAVVSRNQLLTMIWGYHYEGETRTVDVHINTLRQKLGGAGQFIETIRGVGYRIL